MKKKAISLFSGMGGDSLGITQAGLKIVGYIEKEEYMRKTYNLNFQNLLFSNFQS